jgi:hypothetical protein
MAVCRYFEGGSNWTNKKPICKKVNKELSESEAKYKCKTNDYQKCPYYGK